MKKTVLVVFSLVLSAIPLIGCDQPIEYSEKFEGIPIYPGMELAASSEFEEYYEMFEFKGKFQEVIDYYMNEIDSKNGLLKRVISIGMKRIHLKGHGDIYYLMARRKFLFL